MEAPRDCPFDTAVRLNYDEGVEAVESLDEAAETATSVVVGVLVSVLALAVATLVAAIAWIVCG